jgi:hypothetical protein
VILLKFGFLADKGAGFKWIQPGARKREYRPGFLRTG